MSREILDFGRDSEHAARIYLQHWIIANQLGFLLDPTIPTDNAGLRIADIGCGSGVWITELAKALPHAQLEGYDISSVHFPLEHELPANVKLGVLDSFAPVPEDLVGYFDIVHCRGFMLFVPNGDPGTLIANIKDMLKPGGHLHWEELDVAHMYVRSEKGPGAFPFAEQYITQGLRWLDSRGIDARWISELDKFLSMYDLDITKKQARMSIDNSMAKPWATMQLMATRDFIINDIIPTCHEVENGLTPDQWREMLEQIPLECQTGARILMDLTWTVGKKKE